MTDYISEYLKVLSPNTLLFEEKTTSFRWLIKNNEKILQQLVIKKYIDHYEEEWRDLEEVCDDKD